MTKPASLSSMIRELANILDGLIRRHEEMHAVIRAKLESMRLGDVDGMLAGARRERDLTEAVSRLSEERIRVVTAAAKVLNLPVPPTAISVRMLAARLEPAERGELLGRAHSLREWMVAVGEANRTVEYVCREMLMHFKTVFTSIVRGGDTPVTYQRDGDLNGYSGVQVLDALG